MLFSLDICVNKKAPPPQLIMCIGVSTLPHLKNMTPSFAKSPLTSENYPSPPLIKKYFIYQPPFAVMNNVFSK